MALKLSVQEVFERLNESETESDGEDTVAVKEEAVSGRLKKCLSRFLRRERIELGKEEDFLDSVVDAIVPLFELANASDGCSPGFFSEKGPYSCRTCPDEGEQTLAGTYTSTLGGAKFHTPSILW